MESTNSVEWSEYYQELSQLVHDVEHRQTEKEHLDLLKERLNSALESLNLACCTTDDRNEASLSITLELMGNFSIFNQLVHRDIKKSRLAIYQYEADKQTAGPGRPKFIIKEETLINFRELGYSWTDIASILMVSRWTLRRRVSEFAIQDVTGYSQMSDEELDSTIRHFRQMHGAFMGRSMVTGHLKSLGLRIQQRRITKALVRIDPSNSRIRWACLIYIYPIIALFFPYLLLTVF